MYPTGGFDDGAVRIDRHHAVARRHVRHVERPQFNFTPVGPLLGLGEVAVGDDDVLAAAPDTRGSNRRERW